MKQHIMQLRIQHGTDVPDQRHKALMFNQRSERHIDEHSTHCVQTQSAKIREPEDPELFRLVDVRLVEPYHTPAKAVRVQNITQNQHAYDERDERTQAEPQCISSDPEAVHGVAPVICKSRNTHKPNDVHWRDGNQTKNTIKH